MDSQTSNFPVDVVERVLSFLSIPTICRMRVVCKEWNELANNATFHALCDKNRKNKDYLFLWRKDNVLATGRKSISPRFGETFHFFDLDMERWYSIPSTQVKRSCSGGPNHCAISLWWRYEEMAQWFLSMDNGLVCEAVPFYGKDVEGRTLSLSILDPIAKTGRGLPSPDLCFPPPSSDDIDPSLVIVVDQVTHRYKVFFFNTLKDMPLVYVLESDTQKWRPIGGLTHPMDDTIAFRNTVFASLNKGASFEECFQLRLFRYQVEGDVFAKVWQMNFQRRVVYSKLLVRHNRLFVLVITRPPRSILISDSEDESEPEPEACFQTHQDERGALFEMYEILLDEGSSKPVVQFTEAALHAIWRGDVCDNFWFAYPCFDSDGGYSSVVLMQHHSGEMRRFHLATGAVALLPACPLSTTIPDEACVTSTFEAKIMPLSLRDVLKHAPPTVWKVWMTLPCECILAYW